MAPRRSASTFAEKIVAAGPLPEAVQLFVASRRELREPFSQSAQVCDAAFDALYRPDGDRKVAKALCSRPLPPRLRAKVLAAERRPAVLGALLKHNRLDASEMAQVSASCDSPQVADRVLRDNHQPVEVQSAFLSRATPRTAAWWLDRNPLDADDDAVEAAVLRIVGNFERINQGDHRRHVLVLTRLCWLRPRFVAVVASLAGRDLSAARVLAPLHLDAEQVSVVLDGVADVEASGWTALLAADVAACVLDRPDHPREVRRRAGGLLARLASTTAAAEARIGSRASKPYTSLPATVPSLDAAADVDALEVVATDRRVSFETSTTPRSGGFARSFQWADLASNPNLPAGAAAEVAAALGDRRVADTLGAHVAYRAALSLQRHHPEVIAKPRRPATRRRVAPKGDVWSWKPPELGSGDVADRFVVGFVDRWAEPVAQLLTERLGDDPAAWHVAFDLAEEFEGTFAELATAAALTCAN